MIVGINQAAPPLAKYASPHMQAIQFERLKKSLEERGVKIVHVGATAIRINLRGLVLANGNLHNARVALMQILAELNADCCTIEAEDIEYLCGRNVFSQGIARGVEAGVPELAAILSDIPITEDGFEDVVPIMDQLDKAAQFITMDRVENDEVHDRLRQGAERDLVASGLLDHNPSYRDFLEPRPEVLKELPPEFRSDPRPWRSQFDRSDD